jgi:predicted phage-related endonuclease
MGVSIYQDRDAWLAARPNSLGASDVAAACGFSKMTSALEVYTRKAEAQPGSKVTRAMQAGLILERAIAELYLVEQDAELLHPLAVAFGNHADEPELVALQGHVLQASAAAVWRLEGTPNTCTPDYFASNIADLDLLEIKNVTPILAEIDTEKGGWKQGPPIDKIIQVQMQTGILRECGTPITRSFLVPFFGGADVRGYEIEFDEELFELLRDKCGVFWRECVLAKVPPAPDQFATSEQMSRAWKTAQPGKRVELEADELLALQKCRALKDQAEQELDKAEVAIKAKIGDGEFGVYEGIDVIKWKNQVAEIAAKPAFQKKSRPFLALKGLSSVVKPQLPQVTQ